MSSSGSDRKSDVDATVFKARLGQLIKQHGSLRAVSLVSGIDYAYLWRLARGDKANPGKRILKKLGLRRVCKIYYESTI